MALDPRPAYSTRMCAGGDRYQVDFKDYIYFMEWYHCDPGWEEDWSELSYAKFVEGWAYCFRDWLDEEVFEFASYEREILHVWLKLGIMINPWRPRDCPSDTWAGPLRAKQGTWG